MQSDRDLDRELRDVAPHIEYPTTPDLAGTVRDRLESENETVAVPQPQTRPPFWWAAAAALVLFVALPVFAMVLTFGGGSMSGGTGGMAGGGGAEAGRTMAGEMSASGSDEMPTSGGEPGDGGSPESASAAACAYPSPTLKTRPARGAPGDEFRLRGRHFVAGFSACDDTPRELSAQTVPAGSVRVVFRQDGRTWRLGSVEAGGNARISTMLRVPVEARPGRATVRATYGHGPPKDPYGRQAARARFLVLDE